MKHRLVLLAELTLSLALLGCVTEEVREPASAGRTILEFPVGVVSAGIYHSVTFFFEVDLRKNGDRVESADLPDVARWNERERDREQAVYRQLPPIVPEIDGSGREIYRLRDLHRVDFYNTMLEAGKYRYPLQPKARLYVFKKRQGDFSFKFLSQPIVVPAGVEWIPSVYYYTEEEDSGGRGRGRRRIVREILKVGLATLEAYPNEGYWLVSGKRYYPNPDTPLVLYDAIHSLGTR